MALPEFLAFARDCVLVAHNAPFDVGFLKHAAAQQERPWPRFDVVDTAVLARRVVHRGEVRNHKLSSLAQLFDAEVTPNHRALSDARATVDVLHGLIGRLGNLGVQTLEELQTYTSRVTVGPAQEAAPRRAPPPRAGGLPLPRRPGAGALRRDLQGPPQARALLLHRVRDPLPHGPDGHPGEPRRGHRVRHRSGGRRPRAAAHRRAQAEVQPPLPLPRAGPLGAPHQRDLAAAVDRAQRPRRRPGHRPLRRTSRRPSAPWPPSSTSFPLRQCSTRMPRLPRLSACALAELDAACPPATSRSTKRRTPAPPRTSARPSPGARTRVVDGPPRAHRRALGRRALRGGSCQPRPARGLPQRRRARPTPDRADPLRGAGGRAQGARVGGRSTSSARAGSPPPA